jgi:hypothetical protein
MGLRDKHSEKDAFGSRLLMRLRAFTTFLQLLPSLKGTFLEVPVE